MKPCAGESTRRSNCVLPSLPTKNNSPTNLANFALAVVIQGGLFSSSRAWSRLFRKSSPPQEGKAIRGCPHWHNAGKERDELVKDSTFLRFLPPSSRPRPNAKLTDGTVYLVATSAGEVGVNLSADELVCDLSTFEHGPEVRACEPFRNITDSTIDVVHPRTSKPTTRWMTLVREHSPCFANSMATPALTRLINWMPQPAATPSVHRRKSACDGHPFRRVGD